MSIHAFLRLPLLLPIAASAAHADPATERLPEDPRPLYQEIRLRLDPRQTDYSGSVRIELDVLRETATVRLHAEAMTLERAGLRGAEGTLTPEIERLADDLVALHAASPLAPGRWELAIEFTGPYGTQAVGLYRMDRDGEAYAFTQFEADDARMAFPCWDEPVYKIPFQLTLEVPEGFLAVTNTPEERATSADGWQTIEYARTKPLPTYLLAIAVGRFETVELPGLGVPGRIVVPKGNAGLTATAVAETAPILEALEAWFGSPYPYAKLDLIAVPEFWPGAMEHPGAITYRDTALLLDPETSSPAQVQTLLRFTAHELAHQWFGNLVTMEWWDDFWLNEAFADWMGDKITHQLHPEFELPAQELGRTQFVMSGDARPSARPIRRHVEPGESLMEGVGVTYLKGKLVLGQFEEWIGPETFRQGVIDYLEANAWGNATSGDLWAALDAASGRDLSGALSGFIDQPGVPLVSAEPLSGGRVKLAQRRFSTLGTELEPLQWRVPVVLQWGDAGGTKRRTVLLEENETVVELPVQGDFAWIHPNGGARGYYRWTMPARELARLARAAGGALSVVERKEFLGNAGALLDAGVLGGDDYLDVLHGFSSDPAPGVLTGLVSGLERVRGTFCDLGLDEAMACFGRELMHGALDRIGTEARDGEPETVTTFRPRLIGALGDWADDPEIVSRCADMARTYLEDPTAVDPSLVGTALWVAARDGDLDLWETYRERFETATVPADRSRFLTALGGFRDPVARERSLAYVFDGPLQTQELFTIPQAMGDGDEKTADLLADWILDHYDDWASRMPRETLAYLAYAGYGCSRERLARVDAFLSDPARAAPATERQLQRVREQVADCAGLREREGERVAKWLTRYAAESCGAD
jgi:alanyl aminopeptidase